MATLVAMFAKKLISSSLCRGMESKEPIKILQVQETRKSVYFVESLKKLSSVTFFYTWEFKVTLKWATASGLDTSTYQI